MKPVYTLRMTNNRNEFLCLSANYRDLFSPDTTFDYHFGFIILKPFQTFILRVWHAWETDILLVCGGGVSLVIGRHNIHAGVTR